MRSAGGDTRTLRLYGQEVNLTTAAIARMNLYLHDLEDFRVARGDTFRRHAGPTGRDRAFKRSSVTRIPARMPPGGEAANTVYVASGAPPISRLSPA